MLARIRCNSTLKDGSIDKRALGDRFEQLIKRFFETDAVHSTQYEGVWLWGDENCPGRAETLKRLGGHTNRTDYGIDLVARGYDGTLTAIQCKCYADDAKLQKHDVAEFISLGTSEDSGKSGRIFNSMTFVWTGREITSGAQLIIDNNPACMVLDRSVLKKSSVDWQSLLAGTPRRRERFLPRPHQTEAIDRALAGFHDGDRGKLVMACGTGKTFTTLRIAERKVGEGGIVLYLVPSISLLQQSMREWAEQAGCRHRYLAVCSDTKVGKDDEDASLAELEIRPTTDPAKISEALARSKSRMTVVFSTYQSVMQVGTAQKDSGVPFDLMICDEAHRTTGLVRAESGMAKDGGEPDAVAVDPDDHTSGFTAVHSNDSVNAANRLYVTATPKIYAPASIERARQGYGVEAYSMDDEDTYGRTFYNLTFDEAIGKGLLSDYRVVVMTVEEESVAGITRRASDVDLTLNLPAVAKWVGCWKGLVDPGRGGGRKVGSRSMNRVQPLQRVIAFTQSIANSKRFAHSFENVVRHVPTPFDAVAKAKHVDGSHNSLNRRRKLDWLEESYDAANECRILSNAKCLSEGIDVPALDAVVFLNPRESIIDVIQAVGRVMRRAEGKRYGYVILPVAVPSGSDPAGILDRSDTYKVVWNVLRALRAHDSKRFEQRMIDGNVLSDIIFWEAPETCPDCAAGICERHAGQRPPCPDCEAEYNGGSPCPRHAPAPAVDIPDHLIRAKIVEKVSDRRYLEDWARDVSKIVSNTTARINDLYENNRHIRHELDAFHAGLQRIINDSIMREESVDMLAQHMVMGRVFDSLFAGGKFTENNPVSRAMNGVLASLRERGLEAEMEKLEDFYGEVEERVAGITTHGGRQQVIHELYDKFFNHAFKKAAERLGIVYTPIEVVDFILRSSDHLMRDNFDKNLTSRDVNIIDSFTGTGSFVTRLMSRELGLISDHDLLYKYQNCLYASEIVLMAYYIAAVNCESTFLERHNRYVPFDGIALADTFHAKNLDEQWDEGLFSDTQKRIEKQRRSKITLVVGNPPYSAGQKNYNEQNQNVPYPEIDSRIKDTYIRRTKEANPNIGLVRSLYDSYIRSIRWASDRIGESGIIGFVTNASFLRSDAGAGVRACLQEEFTDVWCLDLRGNARTQGKERQKEAGNVFGSGSRAPVAITILVKNPKKQTCTIHYRDIGDCHTREKKLEMVREWGSVSGINDWQTITPDNHHDWIGQRSKEFGRHLPIGDKDTKAGKHEHAIFKMYSNGVGTARDSWVYNSSKDRIIRDMRIHIDYCNKQDWNKQPAINPKYAKWDTELSRKLIRFGRQTFTESKIRTSLYRPFFKQFLYFDHIFNPRQGIAPKAFPNPDSKNLVICVPHKGIGEKFSALVTNIIPDLHLIEQSQCFPLYTYDDSGKRQDNITSRTLSEYRRHYDDPTITKKDIFYYVYGLLHHPKYRSKFANNLSRELPRIPMAPEFVQFSKTGKKLANLHLSWQTCKRYSLGKPRTTFGKYQKMSFVRKKQCGKADSTTLKISGRNGSIVFDNIPEMKYQVGGRTPLEWAIKKYREYKDKDRGIINDATDIDVIPLIERLIYVGVESDRLIGELPEEFEPENWMPPKAGITQFVEMD